MSSESPLNIQMRKLAEYAVNEASRRFGQTLDFTEESLQILEMLLQQAYTRQKELAHKNKLSNDTIQRTSRIWGAYLGELIRHKWGGNWIANKDDVFLIVQCFFCKRGLDHFGSRG